MTTILSVHLLQARSAQKDLSSAAAGQKSLYRRLQAAAPQEKAVRLTIMTINAAKLGIYCHRSCTCKN